jgi:arginase family enzyme
LHALADRYGLSGHVSGDSSVGPLGLPRGGGRPADDSSPVIGVDHQACILCDRCVRACDEVQSNEVITRSGKGYSAKIAFDLDLPMGSSSCVSCGECMDACPTDALVNKRLAAAVGGAIQAGSFPLVIGSSCEISQGILGGFDHPNCGVVWLDAHGDFNTPETTISGFFPGMALSVVAGDCYQTRWAQIGDNTPVPAEKVLLLGVRDLDPLEATRLERLPVRMIGWREGEPQGDVEAALDALAGQTREVYLHIDYDALDPAAAPDSIVFPALGGMSLDSMAGVIRGVASRFRVRAAGLTAFNPDNDPEGIALRAGLRIIELLGECAPTG